MKNKTFVIYVFLLAVVIFGVCFFAFRRSTPNVIFISLDTTRADHLSCYGYGKNTTPNIDKFASENILFETVVSPVPMTFPSHSTVFTGTNPLYHGVHDNIGKHFDDYNISLAEKLKDKGYTTGAIVSTAVLGSKNGLNQGFDRYLDFNKDTAGLKGKELGSGRKAEQTTDLACDWLEENSKDEFFLFVHYFDAHLPYEPPEPYATEYKDDLYAGEIAYMDENIGRLFDKLKAMDLYDDTVIVVFGDHGEMLGEHGETEHSYYVYESAIKVPMIIKPAGVTKAARVKENVGLVDIMPTVYSMLDIAPESVFHGEDVSRFFDGKTVRQQKKFYYIESMTPTLLGCNSLLGVVEGNWKYIQTTRPELYDVAKDRAEASNLIDQEPHRARLMKESLEAILEEQVYKGEVVEKKEELDAESIKQLASLGYVGGGVEEDFQFDQSKADPKDMIHIHEPFKEATKLFASKEFDKAVEICKELQGQMSETALGYDLMGNIAYERRDMKTAIENYRKALEVSPDMLALLQKLAMAYQGNKQHAEAVDVWQRFLEIEPENVSALNEYATGLANLAKTKLAMDSWKKSLEVNPAQSDIHDKLAKLYYLKGDMVQVAYYWKEALKHNPERDQVLNDLAWVYATERESEIYNPAEAVKLALEACRVTLYSNPGHLDTLSVAYAEIGSYDRAISYGQRAVEIFKATDKIEEAKETQKRIENYK